ncbi:MAG TPA: hypothetical protein PLP88_12260 [Bacteroidales bacterium]|nr:hypothetical protein [Bacteroidales bacterium]
MHTNNNARAMKKIFVAMMFLLSTTFSTIALASGPPPPPGGGGSGSGGGHGQGGNQPTAPIGGGLEILLVLGMAYAGKKVYKLRKEEGKE